MNRDQTILEHEAFRNILQALSRPGTVHEVSRSVSGREPALELVASCLLDAESSIASLRDDDAQLVTEICRLTGCVRTAPELADFVLAGSGATMGRISRLRTGDPDYPDQGATVIYLVDEIRPEGGAWSWKGPGIQTEIRPDIDGLGELELGSLRDINHSYPLGLDAIFLDRLGKIAALPRSTRIEESRP